jgi:hypothetical protein
MNSVTGGASVSDPYPKSTSPNVEIVFRMRLTSRLPEKINKPGITQRARPPHASTRTVPITRQPCKPPAKRHVANPQLKWQPREAGQNVLINIIDGIVQTRAQMLRAVDGQVPHKPHQRVVRVRAAVRHFKLFGRLCGHTKALPSITSVNGRLPAAQDKGLPCCATVGTASLQCPCLEVASSVVPSWCGPSIEAKNVSGSFLDT